MDTTSPLRVVFEPRAEPHAPDLYAYDAVVEGVEGFEAVGKAEFARYHEDGYLLVRRAFSGPEVKAARAALHELGTSDTPACEAVYFEGAIRALLSSLADEPRDDKRRLDYEDLALGHTHDRLPELASSLRFQYVRKFMGFADRDPSLGSIAEHAGLANVLERLLGGRPQLYQDMAMIKPPGGREKPWHQDRAYFNLAQETPVAAAWIALDAATPENGCMRLIPGEHRRGPLVHFMRRDWQICDAHLPGRTKRVAAPMEAGDCLLFDALLPHGTPRNDTSQARWALQYHYVPVGAEPVADEERLAVFGTQGKNVTC